MKKSNREAARYFGIDEKRVRDWKKQKSELKDLPSKKRRLEGAGRKPLLPEIEDQLEEWIQSLRESNIRVTVAKLDPLLRHNRIKIN